MPRARIIAPMEAPPYSTARVDVVRIPDGAARRTSSPSRSRSRSASAACPVAVTMRTPGHDEELALGFALSEGLRPRGARAPGRPRREHDRARRGGLRSRAPAAQLLHVVVVRRVRQGRARGRRGRGAARRERSAASPAELVASLPERLRAEQAAFAATGGLHATGLFDADGELLALREDVGRHNAMDKVIGRAFLDGRLPLARRDPLRQRPALVRARAEGGRRGLSAPRRRRCAVVARRRARA